MASKDKRCYEPSLPDDEQGENGKVNMKAGRRGKPQIEINRPGSGPLRKTNHGDDEPIGVNDRKCKYLTEDLPVSGQEQARGHSLGQVPSVGNKPATSDCKRRTKRPEQAIYIPKPIIERDYCLNENWDAELELKATRNRRHDRLREGHHDDNSHRYQKGRTDDAAVCGREIRQASEPHIFPPKSMTIDTNRTRDTRSVEPMGTSSSNWGAETLQAKPPSGRRGSGKDIGNSNKVSSKPIPVTFSAPRFKKKYLAEDGLATSVDPTLDDTWDGSSVTFLGSGKVNVEKQQPSVCEEQQSCPQPLLSQLPLELSTVPETAPRFWSHTLPSSRSRGRGRLPLEEVQMAKISSAAIFNRSRTPDHVLVAPPSNHSGTITRPPVQPTSQQE